MFFCWCIYLSMGNCFAQFLHGVVYSTQGLVLLKYEKNSIYRISRYIGWGSFYL
jgi:hypothetical protein